jgi:hypothetical protein
MFCCIISMDIEMKSRTTMWNLNLIEAIQSVLRYGFTTESLRNYSVGMAMAAFAYEAAVAIRKRKRKNISTPVEIER